MTNPTLALIEKRVSANRFDAAHALSETEIAELVGLATRAPSAYNLQNWRFIAARMPEAKMRLRRLAHDQPKVTEAAVTFIVCGLLPDHADIPTRLRSFTEEGFMPASMASGWEEGARAQYADKRVARDEAVRSATFGAATLIHAAEAKGFATGPIGGFDAEGVARAFGLEPHAIPVLLVAVGRAAPGNWPQKPRRPLHEVLHIS
ncbi:nitroreductase family protein [Aestuariivirga sp. YIM B02566]|uniref:Nitroreductase family protein n=1 Tax=Taklimakanibacter albus TaxID=2800327 RepID=A0ACC5R2C5_9HYPH|nr:nitroreductase family protein [Aestuariivirga sp. YIM B02566]MBK1866785.1 nitroreductase family protein [Aestuariivirga sp. YIM B02566]